MVAVSLFVQLFSYGTFRTIICRTDFSYRYFSYKCKRGGGKITRQGGEKSSPKEQFMRGYTAPYAKTFAPSSFVFVRKVLVQKVILPESGTNL